MPRWASALPWLASSRARPTRVVVPDAGLEHLLVELHRLHQVVALVGRRGVDEGVGEVERGGRPRARGLVGGEDPAAGPQRLGGDPEAQLVGGLGHRRGQLGGGEVHVERGPEVRRGLLGHQLQSRRSSGPSPPGAASARRPGRPRPPRGRPTPAGGAARPAPPAGRCRPAPRPPGPAPAGPAVPGRARGRWCPRCRAARRPGPGSRLRRAAHRRPGPARPAAGRPCSSASVARAASTSAATSPGSASTSYVRHGAATDGVGDHVDDGAAGSRGARRGRPPRPRPRGRAASGGSALTGSSPVERGRAPRRRGPRAPARGRAGRPASSSGRRPATSSAAYVVGRGVAVGRRASGRPGSRRRRAAGGG